MPLLFWDASALAKRYTEEVGSDAVDAIFAAVPASSMVTTVWGYAETFFIFACRAAAVFPVATGTHLNTSLGGIADVGGSGAWIA